MKGYLDIFGHIYFKIYSCGINTNYGTETKSLAERESINRDRIKVCKDRNSELQKRWVLPGSLCVVMKNREGTEKGNFGHSTYTLEYVWFQFVHKEATHKV